MVRHWRVLLVICLLFTEVGGGIGGGKGLAQTGNPSNARFRRPGVAVTFRQPEGYRMLPATRNIPFAVIGPNRGQVPTRIYLTVKPASAKALPADQAARLVGALERMHPGYRSVARGRFLLSGEEAVMVVGLHPATSATSPASATSAPPSTVETCVVAALHQKKMYVFHFAADAGVFKAELPAFVRMVDSVRWIGKTANPVSSTTDLSALLNNSAPPTRQTALPQSPELADASNISRAEMEATLEASADQEAVELMDLRIGFNKPAGYRRSRLNLGKYHGYVALDPTDPRYPPRFYILATPFPASEFPPGFHNQISAMLMQKWSGSELLKSEQLRLVDSPALLSEFRAKTNTSLTLRVHHYMLLHNSRAYFIGFMCLEESHAEQVRALNTLLESLRWLQ